MRHALEAVGNGGAARLRGAYLVEGGLIGQGRAGEIVVNAVLPTVAAWAEIGHDRRLYGEALRLYAGFPSLPVNSVFEEAKRVLARRGVSLKTVRGRAGSRA